MAEIPLDKILRSWAKQTQNLITGKEYSQERLEKIINCPSLYNEESRGTIYAGDKRIELNARKARNVLSRDLMECMKHVGAHPDEFLPEQWKTSIDVICDLSSKLTEKIVTTTGLNRYAFDCYEALRKMRDNCFNIDIVDTEMDDDNANLHRILIAL